MEGRRLFGPAYLDDFPRHGVMPNVKVFEGALRLCAPVAVGRDLDRAHAVGFESCDEMHEMWVDGGGRI